MLVRTIGIVFLGFVSAARTRADEPRTTAAPPRGEVLERVSGSVQVEAKQQPDGTVYYYSKPYRVTTPLPVGYPPPTPPGAIDIKRYPEVRRATYSGKGEGPDGMRNSAAGFWPLFAHIKTRGIAMTAPVEIEYEGLETDDQNGIEGWQMSFLYRDKGLGSTESYANIAVKDAQPMTVFSTGVAGNATRDSMNDAMQILEDAIAMTGGWQTAGPVRVLGYNGPDVRANERWSEVQLPVVSLKAKD